MDAIQKLAEVFREFPGIGPRQAKRFVYYLLAGNSRSLEELSSLILKLKKEVEICKTCFRFFPKKKEIKSGVFCDVCDDDGRDDSILMIVPRDVDFESIEKSGFYRGRYFVLGGTVPILDKEPEERIRSEGLIDAVKKKTAKGLKEIIIAVNLNPEGENTADFVTRLLLPVTKKTNVRISTLGRGFSTGTELEYSDSDTIKNALKNRSQLI